MNDKTRVGIIGAGHWAETAHIPSFLGLSDAKVVAICDNRIPIAERVASKFSIPEVYQDYHELINREDIDIIDICSSAISHFPIAKEALPSKKAILCEKPLAVNFAQAKELSRMAVSGGVHTKMGFTFRHSPALRRAKELIDEGFIGRPYIFNGFEQNSQFIDPMRPFRWAPSDDQSKIIPGSLEEYAPHLIDIALWFMGDIKEVNGRLRNFIPDRNIRDFGKVMPINIEDTCICLAEFSSGAQATLQSSFIAIGGYPGVEARVYGSKGAIIAELVEMDGGTRFERLRAASPEQSEFKEIEIPERLYGDRKKSQTWSEFYFSSLVSSFVQEVREGKESAPNFSSGAKVQEVEEAIYLSHLKKSWISLPL